MVEELPSDRDRLIAYCLRNLKGSKSKDLMGTAKSLGALRRMREYGSNTKVAEAVGVSPEIVREFLTLLDLPAPVQELIEQRRLNLEQGRRLWQLQRSQPGIVREVAEAMTDLTAHDSRHLVEYLRHHPNVAVPEAKQELIGSKTIYKREYQVLAVLSEDRYRALERSARDSVMSVNELVTMIVELWLSEKADEQR